jgi:DNA-binding IclR family transcriptional regulator
MAEHEKDSALSGREGTQVLHRAMQVLRAVACIQHAGATLAAITRTTALSRSTAFRLVHFLTDEGLLEYDRERGTYHIGPLAFELGLAARGPAELIGSWRPRLEQISSATRMTAYLVARSGTDVVCLATAEAPSILRAVSLVVGQRLPLGVGAGSLAILSSLEDEEIHALMALNKDRFGMYGDSLLTAEKLWPRIKFARNKGFAFSEDSVAQGVRGIGIAMSGTAQLTRLAVSVSAPSSQVDMNRLEEVAAMLARIAATA